MAIDRSKMRKALKERQDESARTAEGNANFIPIFSKDIPLDVIGKIPEGAIVFDIIPFQVSEDFLIDPETRRAQYRSGEDDWYYNLDLYVHQRIGPNNHNIICPRKHMGKPCPICEIADRNKKDIEFGDKERWKEMVAPFMPKRRCVYQVWVHKLGKSTDEEDKGVQILEMAHFCLEKTLVEIAKDPETGETIDFAWPGVEGKKISFTRKGTGMENTQFLAHKFLDRKEDIPDDILDQAIPINEFINLMEPEEIREILEASKDDEGEEEKPSRKPLHNEEDGEEPARKPRRTLGRKAQEEEPEEDGKSVRKGREEKSTRRRPRDEEDNPCPNGHAFGIDTEKFDDCQECPDRKYNACLAKKEAEEE